MSEFIQKPPEEAHVEELSQETVEISSSVPLKATTRPSKLTRQMQTRQNIFALQRTIGNQAVQRLIKQTLQRHAGHKEQEVQRLMTKTAFQVKTPFKAGKRGVNNPVLLDIDRLLDAYNKTDPVPTAQRKQEILQELTVVKDWLDKEDDASPLKPAIQELWDDIVREGKSDPQANVVSLPATDLHQTLTPDSLYALAKQPPPPGLDAAIKELQNKLNTGLLPNPNLNSGKFDAATEQAVKDFKANKNLPKPTDGTVDRDVWAALDIAGKSNIGLVSYKSTQQQLNMTSQLNVKYTWEVKDDELRIIVKINFNDETLDKKGAVVNGLGNKKDGVVNNIKGGIDTVWNQFKIVETTTKKARNLVFDVQSVTSNDQDVAKVGLRAGDGRSNGGVWYAGDPDLTSKTGPHEFGHLVGLADEYGRGHADYFKLTGLKPLQEKSGLTDANADACATKLRNALADGVDLKTAKKALVKASDIMKDYGIYNKPGTGQPVMEQFPEVVDELNRVFKLIGGRQIKLSLGTFSGKLTAGDLLEQSITPFSFQSKSIMGSMDNATPGHDHGVEPRHVRFFAGFVEKAIPGTYDVEKR